MTILIQIIGWGGALLALGAYLLLVTSDKVDENTRIYQVMNLLGAAGLGINAYYSQAWPLVGLNVVWALIAVESLVRKRK